MSVATDDLPRLRNTMLTWLNTAAEALGHYRFFMCQEAVFTGYMNVLDTNSPHCAKTIEEAISAYGACMAYLAQWEERNLTAAAPVRPEEMLGAGKS